jgi:tRNA threonylcarbamoyladenosine modification (KEOPS) complex  Pcc1 subunit
VPKEEQLIVLQTLSGEITNAPWRKAHIILEEGKIKIKSNTLSSLRAAFNSYSKFCEIILELNKEVY